MAIIDTLNRPAINIIQDSFTPPPGVWETRLGDGTIRNRLQAAISAVGRLDYVGEPYLPAFGGTAFVVGPDLLMSYGSMRMVTMSEGDTYSFIPGRSAMVDFKRELIPTESASVKIDEVLYVDSRCGIELLRAKLPDNITPLRLSVRHPQDLINRYVALIGYPAMDNRSDLELVQRIFAATYDVKRLLPGQVIGYEQYKSGNFLALTHDCTTTGGCGGAPLIDLENGEVVGIHFAGMYLHANYAVSSWELARDPVLAAHGVLFAGPLPEPVSPAPVTEESIELASDVSEVGVERSSVADLAPDDPDSSAANVLEQIVLASSRPAFVVDGGRAKYDGPWEPILKPHEARLELAIRAVGKIRLEGGVLPSAGTAFVVGSGLAMAASHSVLQFASGSRSAVTLQSGVKATIDFSDALALPRHEATARVVKVRFIHPFFQVALLELDEVPPGVASLDLAAQVPSQLAGRTVVVLSFVDQGSREPGDLPEDLQEKIFGNQLGRLFVQPGYAMQLGQTPGSNSVPALLHDCFTAGGSDGAPVIDVETGYVIGVHTHGEYLVAGYAQPSWEIARDPKVWGHPIRFRPDPRPSWLGSWDDPLSVSQAPVANPERKPDRWTVDDIPIDFQREEPKNLERLLYATIDARMALYLAENVGLQLGSVNSSLSDQLLWRALLKQASVAGVLRRLIQTIADAPEYAGIAPKLREVL